LDYILTLLLVKYVSDKAKADPKKSLTRVPKGGSFDDMLAAKGDKEIGDMFNKIIAKLAEANGLRNVIGPRGLQRRGEAGQEQGDGRPAVQPGDDL
jgi:type I restriction-modification system DNA methylase subunit